MSCLINVRTYEDETLRTNTSKRITDTHDSTAKVTRVMARQKMEMEQPTYPMVDSAARWPAVSCAERPTGDVTNQNERSAQ